jgi:ABC-type sugar transport system ATPase subunit
MAEFILEAKNISKTFPGVRALNNVNLNVRKGEVHAIVGENGAGKSTRILTLGGIYKPDSGEIYVDGQKVWFDSAHDANQKGIGVVYQELSLAQNLSVAENIFANRQPVRKFNLIDQKALNQKAAEMLALANADNIRPDMPVKDLSVANQQVVEILKAMSFNPKALILDEPTSSLASSEVGQLFKNIRRLKENGVAIIYISHHLQELFEIADEEPSWGGPYSARSLLIREP